MALYIGFANKYYTLWEVTSSSRVINESMTTIITYHRFMKNISFDKAKAMAKYPNATVDESLRGKTKSWKSFQEVWNNVDTFRFGRSKYNKIETEDISYVEWYWNNCPAEQKEYVGNYLIANGYEIRNKSYINSHNEFVEYYVAVSPKELEEERIQEAKRNSIVDGIIENDKIEFTPVKNLNEDGDYFDTEKNVIYHFTNVKTYCYDGYYYCLPIDTKGKAKRIKNKTIISDDFSWEFDNYQRVVITINTFELVK